MHACIVFWILEIKRAWKRIGRLIAGALLLFALGGTTAFLAGKLLYGEAVSGRIQVGVVLPEKDALAEKLFAMIASLDSVGSLCDFQYLEREEALDGLADGSLYAVMEVPEGMVQSILDGTNTPVRVLMPKQAGTESRIFRELTQAGARILGASQAGIYAGDELAAQAGAELGIPTEVRQAAIATLERELNEIFLSYSLSRQVYFLSQQVSATGEVSLFVYYGVSLSVLALLLLAIPVSDYLLPWGAVMKRQLSRGGVGAASRGAGRILGLGSLYLAAASVAWIGYGYGTGFENWPVWGLPVLLLGCLAASALVVLLFELSGSLLGGVMLLFVAGVGQHILAGGFLPVVFLPEAVRGLAWYLPSGILMGAGTMMVSGVWDGSVLARLSVLTGVLFLGIWGMEVRDA